MSTSTAPAPQQDWSTKRRWPRYPINLFLKIFIQRNGRRQSASGRSIEVSIGGMSCYAPVELLLCEKVEIELLFPDQQKPHTIEAIVRNRKGHRYGLEFCSPMINEPARLLQSCYTLTSRKTL